MKLVVIGYGNPSRGDDALGIILLRRFDELGCDGAICFEDFQLQLEHALDLQDCDLALFIDAGTNTKAPYFFEKLMPNYDVAHTSHALSPQAVLGVYKRVTGNEPPPAFLLCVAGEGFELGADLSDFATQNLAAAWEFLKNLTTDISLEAWSKA